MKPVFQTRDGVGGNCLQAALASLLEMPLDVVPDFMSEPDGVRTWPGALGAWLYGRGLELIPVAPHGDLPTVLEHMAAFYPAELYIFGGRTGLDHGHAVVGCGGEIVHNPSAEEPAFVGPIPYSGRYLALLIRPLSVPVLPAPMDFEPLSRHEHIASAFSGGKDSLVVWHALAEYHPRMTIYSVDTGDRAHGSRSHRATLQGAYAHAVGRHPRRQQGLARCTRSALRSCAVSEHAGRHAAASRRGR